MAMHLSNIEAREQPPAKRMRVASEPAAAAAVNNKAPERDRLLAEQLHREEQQQPEDSLDVGPSDSRPLCQYGSSCYRENPEHRKQFRHIDPQLAAHTQRGGARPPPGAASATNTGDTSNLAFRMLRTRNLSHPEGNHGVVRLWDILEAPESMHFALISNYMIDLSWMKTACPGLRDVGIVALVNGDGLPGFCGLPSNFVDHRPDLPVDYGSMHTKCFVIGYPTGIRVCISTANLIKIDYNDKTNGVWVQDFPWKKDVGGAPETSVFEEDLLEYCEAIGWRKDKLKSKRNCENHGPSGEVSFTDISALRRADYSHAQVRLCGSVPGWHKDKSKFLWGHMKLRRVLNQERFEPKFKAAPVVCQYSSMGSLTERWLEGEFSSSLCGGRIGLQGAAPSVSDPPLGRFPKGPSGMQLIHPTIDEVGNSLPHGYAAGQSIPTTQKNVEKEFLQKFYHRWTNPAASDPSGRSRSMPHIKTYCRYRGQELAWCLLTSSNMSRAAWGDLQVNDSQLFVRSYELGALFVPSTMAKFAQLARPFSCTTEAIPHPRRLSLTFPATVTTGSEARTAVKMVTRAGEKECVGEEEALRVVFPLPYCLPPVKYDAARQGGGDKPWIVQTSQDQPQIVYAKPDSRGANSASFLLREGQSPTYGHLECPSP